MIQSSLQLIIGIVLLMWSADWFVHGAATAARRLRVSPLVVGMVVVGFGTSLPELAVSFLSAWEGSPGLALGNALGSNITNLALILGLTAIVRPVRSARGMLRRQILCLIASTLLAGAVFYDLNLVRMEGVLLVAAFGLVMWSILQPALQNSTPDGKGAPIESLELPEEATAPVKTPLGKALMMMSVGLLVVLGSSQLLVTGAVEIARFFGVGELVIGLTVVAVGTSLPELASAVAAARHGENEMVLGNVLGSNLFNTLMVTGMAGIIRPTTVDPELLWRDMVAVLALTLALPLLVRTSRSRLEGVIGRRKGVLLVLAFLGYTLYLVISISPGSAGQ